MATSKRGKPRAQNVTHGWICCDHILGSSFCPECGAKRPTDTQEEEGNHLAAILEREARASYRMADTMDNKADEILAEDDPNKGTQWERVAYLPADALVCVPDGKRSRVACVGELTGAELADCYPHRQSADWYRKTAASHRRRAVLLSYRAGVIRNLLALIREE